MELMGLANFFYTDVLNDSLIAITDFAMVTEEKL